MDYHCNLSCIYIYVFVDGRWCTNVLTVVPRRGEAIPTDLERWPTCHTVGFYTSLSGWVYWFHRKARFFCTYDRSLQHFPTNSSNLIDLSCFFLSEPLQSVILKLQRAFFFPAPSGLGMQQLLLVKLGASFVVFTHNLVIRKVLQRSSKDVARISRSWGSKSYDWLTTQEEKSWSFREHQKMWPHNANSSQVTLAWQVCFQGWSWKKLNLVMTILAT